MSLAFAVEQAHSSPLLNSLGAPRPAMLGDEQKHGVIALNLAAAYHRLAVIAEVMLAYATRAALGADDYPALGLVSSATAGRKPADCAAETYCMAIDIAPTLAEAHFGLARLEQLRGDGDAALPRFDQVLRLSPHEDASPHAHLHANAQWERASLLRARGRNEEALVAYRVALASLASFGVHHVEAARFLRSMGFLEEAMTHYRRCMSYSHRYFAEFMPPSPDPVMPHSPARMEAIYAMPNGDVVVFWDGKYVQVAASWLSAQDHRTNGGAVSIPGDTRRAASIAALVP